MIRYTLLMVLTLIMAFACGNGPIASQASKKEIHPPVDSVAKADSILKLKYDKTNWSITIRTELARWDSCKARQIDSAIMVILKLPSSWSKTRESIFALDTIPYGHIYSFGRQKGNEYAAFKQNPPPPPPVEPEPYYPMTEKPVIYIYPTKEQATDITLHFTGNNLYTYPKADSTNSWHVTAMPDGTLKMGDGKEYPYLFWEGTQTNMSYADYTEGFVVDVAQLEDFLDEKLTLLGLNARERADFITYWAPKQQGSEQVFVRFETTAYSHAQPLSISPAPESMQRIYALFMPVPKGYNCRPQVLIPFTRSGYTVIEWGGSQIMSISN